MIVSIKKKNWLGMFRTEYIIEIDEEWLLKRIKWELEK